ncbi:MAG: tetratricopeptide repeat-containing sensor histidine kinase [Bacteroidales bacterium]|nr:tetratricopeptide repeat-containing sensor histidine kinase [Bacteroidales bacterium]
MSKSLKIFLLFLVVSSSIFAQKSEIDSLKIKLNKCINDTNDINIRLQIIDYYINANSDTALLYTFVGIKKYGLNDFEKGLTYCLQRLSRIYKHKGNYLMSLNILQKALNKAESSKSKVILLLELTELNRTLENFQEAIINADEAIVLLKVIKDITKIDNAYNRKAAIYYEMFDFEQTIIYVDSSLIYAKLKNDSLIIASNFEILGAVQNNNNNHDLAIFYFNKALEINNKLRDSNAIQNNYSNIAITYFLKHEYKDAIPYLKKSLYLCQKNNLMFNLLTTYKYLALCYEATKDYKNAYITIDTLLDLRIMLFNSERDKQLQELNKKYEVEKKELLLAQSEENLAHKEIIINQQKRQKYGLILVILMVFAFSLFVLSTKKKLKNKNLILKEQRDEIEEQKEELVVAKDKLEQMSEFKQNMTQMIVHDLKNPLSRIINYTANEPENEYKIIYNTSIQMLNMVENILSYSKYEETNMVLDLRSDNLGYIISTAFERTEFLFKQKGVKFFTEIEENYNVLCDTDILTRIFVNLLTNAVKHTPSSGEITIKAQRNDDFVIIKVIDTGSGINPKDIDFVFEAYKQSEIINYANINSTGLGLAFCKKAVEAHGGKIIVKSKLGEGTVFEFNLKLLNANNINVNISVLKDSIEVFLSDDEKNYLSPFIQKLIKIEIYEISEIKVVLAEIKTENPNIQKWKGEILDSVSNFNSAKYYKLISI